MKKVLLLSCNTGQGHNASAQAVKEYFEARGVACELKNALLFVSKWFSDFASWGHIFMYRKAPDIFRLGYNFSKKNPWIFEEKSAVYRFLVSGANRLYDYIQDNGFDAVICTHLFPTMILSQLKKTRSLSVKTGFVGTDYTYYPGTESCDVQFFFIAHASLIQSYVDIGIPRERIVPSGIPVQERFREKTDKAEAKRRLGVGAGSRHLLMMCGSMGCGPMPKMLRRIVENMPGDVEVTVICGTNRSLYKRLSSSYRDCPRVHVVGYTDEVPLYMDASDLYLTKPGGISVTEAAVKNLPMAFINAVAGCEQYNMDFFTRMGAAFAEDSPIALADKCVRLLQDGDSLARMEAALRAYHQTDGPKIVYDTMNDTLNDTLDDTPVVCANGVGKMSSEKQSAVNE